MRLERRSSGRTLPTPGISGASATFDFSDQSDDEIGLVADTENHKEMEANFENRYAGEDGPLCALPLGDPKGSWCSAMELNMIPVTPAAFTGGPRSGVGLPSPFSPVAPGGLGLLSSSSSTWAQSPQQETLVLHPDEIRAKLYKICEGFGSKA